MNSYTEAGTVVLDGTEYRLVRPQGQTLSLKTEYIPEPPYNVEAGPLLRVEETTWHAGALKSLPAIPGTSEYGRNTDGRFPLRLFPSPAIHDVDLASSTTNPTHIFRGLGWLFACAGRNVYRVDPTNGTATLSKQFGLGITAVMGLAWETGDVYVCTDEASNSLYKLASGGIVPGGPDTWTTSTTSAYRIVAGINRLFKVSKTGVLRNLSTTLDPMSETNWADLVQVGDQVVPATALVAYDRTVLVGKAEGVFVVSEEGFGQPLIKRMVYHADNCLGSVNFDPYVLFPHIRGLYRWSPGDTRDAGLETELLNQSPVRGSMRALSADGNWVYTFVQVGGDTYCLVGKEKRTGETGFGPFLWETWLYFTGATRASFIDSQGPNPRLWFGRGLDLAYVELSLDGGPPDTLTGDFCTTGIRYSVKQRFGDLGLKNFPILKGSAKSVSSNKYWDLAFNVDGLGWVTSDATGANMRLESDGPHSFTLPTSAHGREIQYRYTFTSDGTLPPPELSMVEQFAIPRAAGIRIDTFHVLLSESLMNFAGMEGRTIEEQEADLQELRAQAQSIAASGPWGEEVQGVIKSIATVQTRQMGNEPVGYVVEIQFQHRTPLS